MIEPVGDDVAPAPEPPGALTDTEPVAVFLLGLAALVDAGIAAATALDWIDLTTEQAAAVIGCVTVATGLCLAVLRGHVYSPATVAVLTAPTIEGG